MNYKENRNRVHDGKEYRQYLLGKLRLESSSVETLRPEDEKDRYIRNLEEKIDRLNTIIQEMEKKKKGLDKALTLDFEQEIADLKNRYKRSKEKIRDLKERGEDAAQAVKTHSGRAWQELADGIKKSLEKF